MKHPISYLTLSATIAYVSLISPATADETDSPAQAAYPRPFSRPASMGDQYDTWRDAKGPDIGETKVDIKRLPPRVDNSNRPEFPPIYMQHGGACGQFTAIASIFTYEMNVLNGTHADSDATRFPADFTWNMVNSTDNRNGSEAYNGWETAKLIGIPTVKSYGTVHRKNAGPWPNGYAIWREAMEYRVAGYRYTPATSISQINEARGWLFDRNQPARGKETIGGILALDGRMGENEEITKTIPTGAHQAGEQLWIKWCPKGFGHGITCVGYDDQVGFDVNGDGKVTNDTDTNGDGKINLADWERGAFIVVNSWGDKWANKGKIYLLYSAMTDQTWERGNYFGRIEVARHTPRITMKLKLSHSKRSDLHVSIGLAADKNASKPDHELAPQFLNGWPLYGKNPKKVGEVPLAGPDDKTALEMGIDLTPLYEKFGPQAMTSGRIFLRFSCTDKSESSGIVHTCSLRHYDKDGTFIRESAVKISDGKFGKTPLAFGTSLE